MTWKTRFSPVIALLTVLWLTKTNGLLTSVPNNMVAKLGDRVEVECSTNETVPDTLYLYTYAPEEASPLVWSFVSATSSTEEFIYRGGYVLQNVSSMYAIMNDTKQGKYNLVISSVDLSFAGTYKCSEPALGYDKPHIASAELIVIASDPVCSYNASRLITKAEHFSMWCTVNYSGNWIPLMEWTSNNGRTAREDIRYTNSSMSLASMLITQLDANDGEVTFTCKTSFKPKTTNIITTLQGVVLAANVPDYQHLWNYTATVSPTFASNTTQTPVLDDGLFLIIGIFVSATILLTAIVTIICKLHKKGKAKPDVVPQVEHNNVDISDRPQPQCNPPLYAEVQRSSNGFQVAENQRMTVYSSVKKERIVGDMNERMPTVTNNHQQIHSIPVYAEVNKIEKDELIPGPSGHALPQTNVKSKQTYVGADGTQYMELDSLTELKSNGVSERHPPMFGLVETYASIDHTMTTPPPPPQLPKRHRN